MIRSNDIEQFSLGILSGNRGILRDRTTKMKMNVERRMTIFHQKNKTIPVVFLQFVNCHTIGMSRGMSRCGGQTDSFAEEDAEFDEKFTLDSNGQFRTFEFDNMRAMDR